MINNPFSSLQSHHSLDVQFLRRDDACSTDKDIARITGNSNLVSLRQMHGNVTHRVNDPSSRVLEGDALATDIPGLTLTIRFADCQGFVLYHPTKNVIAVMHAGWKSMCKKIISSTIALLKTEWDIDPADLLVGAGPSLCRACAVFTDPSQEAPELRAFIDGRTIDLQASATAEFLSLGVLQKNIERMSDCTRCHPELYYTYRGGDREVVTQGFTNVLVATIGEKAET